MIVDAANILKHTSLLVPPLPTTTNPDSHPTSVLPIPSAIPDRPEYQNATETGARTLWVVFVLMTLASAVFAGLSWNLHIKNRLYHTITTLITVIAAISYFGMATGHGVAYSHDVERSQHKHVPDTVTDVYRQVYWARYVDWSLTTPLLLLDLALLSGLSGGHTIQLIAADIIMVLTGLFAAFGTEETAQKWGWYTIACIAYIFVLWHLILNGRAAANARGGNVSSFYTAIAGFTIIIWTAYPIVWGIADGARTASVDAEIISYAVLDVLAKPIFGLWLLIVHARTPETAIDLSNTWWSTGLGGEGRVRLEEDDGA